MENTDQEMDYFDLDTLYEEYELPRSPTGSISSQELEQYLDLSALRQEQEQLMLAETAKLITLPHHSPWTGNSNSLEPTSHITPAEIKNETATTHTDCEKLDSCDKITSKDIICYAMENSKKSHQIAGFENICSLPETHLMGNKGRLVETVFLKNQEISEQLLSYNDFSSCIKGNENKIMLVGENSDCINNKDCVIKLNKIVGNDEINKNTFTLESTECMTTTKLNINVATTSSKLHTEYQLQELTDDSNKDKKENISLNRCESDTKSALENMKINKFLKQDVNVHQNISSDHVINQPLLVHNHDTLKLKEICVSKEDTSSKNENNLNFHKLIEGNKVANPDADLIQVNVTNIMNRQNILTENTEIIYKTMYKDITNPDIKMQTMEMENLNTITTPLNENASVRNEKIEAMDIVMNCLEEQINSQVDKEIEELQDLGYEVMLPVDTNIKCAENCKEYNKNNPNSSIVLKDSDIIEMNINNIVLDKQDIPTENCEVVNETITNKDIINSYNKGQTTTANIGCDSTPHDKNVTATNEQLQAVDTMVTSLDEQINSQTDKEIQDLQELGFEVMLPIETNIKSPEDNKLSQSENNLSISCEDTKYIFTAMTVEQNMPDTISNTDCKTAESVFDYITENNSPASTPHEKNIQVTNIQHTAMDRMIKNLEEQIDSQVDKEIEQLQDLGYEVMLPIEKNIISQGNDKSQHTLVQSEPELKILSEDNVINDIAEVFTQSNTEKYDITNEQENSHVNENGVNSNNGKNKCLEEIRSIHESNDYLVLSNESNYSFSEADKCLSQQSNAVETKSENEESINCDSPHSYKNKAYGAEESSLEIDEIHLTPKLDDMDYIDDIDYDDCDPYLTQTTIKSENTEISFPSATTSQIQSQNSDQTTEQLLTFLNTTQDQNLKTFSEFLLPNQPFMEIGDVAVGNEASQLEATLPKESVLSQLIDNDNLPDCISAALPINSDTTIGKNFNTELPHDLTNSVLTQTEDVTTFNVYTQTDVVMGQLENLIQGTKRSAGDQEVGPARKSLFVAHKTTRGQKKISSSVGKLGKQIPCSEPSPPVRKSIRLGLSRCSKPKK